MKPLSTSAPRNPNQAPKPVLELVRGPLTAVRQADWGLVLALALGLLAALPFLTRAGLPHQTDAELHVYRTAELNQIIQEGVLYPRWAANLYLGYGYPIFNYYAPFTYHLGSLFAVVVPGADVVAGVKGVFVLGLLLASVGAYLLGRELSEPAGGVLAAASFTLSPYVLFIDPHARGDLAEHFALCLFPLTFYFVRRLMHSPGPSVLMGSVLSLSAVVFSHNLMGLAVSALLLAYWAWTLLTGPRRRRSVWAPVAFGLAAGLIAFFWLPALVEHDAVKLEVIGPGHFDFREHFLGLRELLAPSRAIDWGATGPRYRHNLGLAQWALGVPALVVLARGVVGGEDGEGGMDLAFFLVGAAALVFLMLPVSSAVWELIPGMPYLQFPWRLLGPANVMLAAAAASTVTLLPDRPWRRGVLGTLLLLVVLTGLPLLYPTPWPEDFGGTSPADIIRWERRSHALGTTSTGDFLPRTVEVIPSVADTLIASYESRGPVDKVNRATIPDGATVEILSHGPRHDRFRVMTPEPFVLRLYTFDFPGWKAYVDGREVDIEIARPEGFITVDVPEGQHTVLVRFEDTPVRRWSWLVSGGTLVALVALLLLWRGRGSHDGEGPQRKLSGSDGAWLGGVLVVVFLLKIALVDPQGWLHLNSAPGEAQPAQQEVNANFEGKIELLGYDLPDRQVRPGGTFSLVLYWHALTTVEKNYQSFVHVAQPLHTVWGQEDHLNPGGLPTERWPLDKYVWDEYEIRVRPETPPGEYKINVGLYLRSEGYRLERYDANGEAVGDSLVIDSIRVTK